MQVVGDIPVVLGIDQMVKQVSLVYWAVQYFPYCALLNIDCIVLYCTLMYSTVHFLP